MSQVSLTGPNNQKATYRLYKAEARALAPEERLALIDCVRSIGKNTSVDLFRKALGI